MAADQQRWLTALLAGEAAARKQAGLAGNPMAALAGVEMQPTLARNSQAYLPINPVEVYYIDQLDKATVRVLYGQQTPADALAQVQRLVLADQQRLQNQYGRWNW